MLSLLKWASRVTVFALLTGLVPVGAEPAAAKTTVLAKTAPAGAKPANKAASRLERNGIVVEFSATAAEPGKAKDALMEGELAEVRFRISDAKTHRPLRGLSPGAWLDSGMPLTAGGKDSGSCKGKMESFLKGVVGVRPMLDLTSYYILVFNQDASISVIDPLVGVAGRTNLFANVILKSPPGDWAKSRDGKRVYVSMPEAGQVAVVDTESFKVIGNLDAGAKPMRADLQPDGRYLWIGNDADTDDAGGVTVIDTQTQKPVARIATGKGHHELAFSDDDRYAFVSNREKGSVTVIDISQAKAVKEIKTGTLPIAMAYSKAGQALYVADGVEGKLTVVPVNGLEPAVTISAKPGLGPMGVTPDGRWLLVVNSKENLVHAVEVATNRLIQDIPVGTKPYQIAFSDAFAYVRSLETEHVGMISLAQIGKPTALDLSTFAAGSLPPKEVPDLGIGSTMAPAVGEAAFMVASPADNLVYYYMEGMLAPSGNFRNPGHNARAIDAVNRSLQEVEPGLYTAKIKPPVAGDYDVGFLLDSPRLLDCFHARVKANPALKAGLKPAEIVYINPPSVARVGETVPWRFRLDDPQDHQAKNGLGDVKVLYYLAPGLMRTEVVAREMGGGIYQADLPIRRTGAYYIHVGIPSLNLKFGDLPYRNLLAAESPVHAPPVQPQEGHQ